MINKETLTETEKRVYLFVSLIYEKILEEEPTFEMGFYSWSQIRPVLLQKLGLGDDVWTQISNVGDSNNDLQNRLADLRDRYADLTKDDIINNIKVIEY